MSAPADATAMVTGATGALGRAIAAALATGGARLALTGRREDALRGLAAELPARDGAAHAPVAADLCDPAAVSTLVERCERAVGPLDVLVHNAAVEHPAAFDRLTAAEIEEIVAVNLLAPMELTRRAVPGMLARGRGHVVVISSLSGYAGTAYQAPYAATKGALITLVQSLRAEYAGRPVRFSLVAPGSVAGDGIFARAQDDGVRVPPALRLTTPGAVARAVVRAITVDAPQTIVYPGPIRPTLALGVLAPRTAERLNSRLGLDTLFRPAAEARGRV
jgi:short-subunit dehydrogenase